MADYTSAKSYEPLEISKFNQGFLPGLKFGAVPYAAFRSYAFAPTGGGAAGRPQSGQLYPRGNR
jgi:hypothetical protein